VKLAVAEGKLLYTCFADGAGNYVDNELDVVHVLALRRVELYVSLTAYGEAQDFHILRFHPSPQSLIASSTLASRRFVFFQVSRSYFCDILDCYGHRLAIIKCRITNPPPAVPSRMFFA